MSQFTGGTLDALRNLTDPQSRLLQLSQNLADTLPEHRKRQQQIANLLGLGGSLQLQGPTGPGGDPLGGLGSFLQFL